MKPTRFRRLPSRMLRAKRGMAVLLLLAFTTITFAMPSSSMLSRFELLRQDGDPVTGLWWVLRGGTPPRHAVLIERKAKGYSVQHNIEGIYPMPWVARAEYANGEFRLWHRDLVDGRVLIPKQPQLRGQIQGDYIHWLEGGSLGRGLQMITEPGDLERLSSVEFKTGESRLQARLNFFDWERATVPYPELLADLVVADEKVKGERASKFELIASHVEKSEAWYFAALTVPIAMGGFGYCGGSPWIGYVWYHVRDFAGEPEIVDHWLDAPSRCRTDYSLRADDRGDGLVTIYREHIFGYGEPMRGYCRQINRELLQLGVTTCDDVRAALSEEGDYFDDVWIAGNSICQQRSGSRKACMRLDDIVSVQGGPPWGEYKELPTLTLLGLSGDQLKLSATANGAFPTYHALRKRLHFTATATADGNLARPFVLWEASE